MDKSFVSDVVWVARGVAKAVPEKVELEEKDLNELLQGEFGQLNISKQVF